MDAKSIAALMGFSSFGGEANPKKGGNRGGGRKRKRAEHFPPPAPAFLRYAGEAPAAPSTTEADHALHTSKRLPSGAYAHGVQYSPDGTRALSCDGEGVMVVFDVVDEERAKAGSFSQKEQVGGGKEEKEEAEEEEQNEQEEKEEEEKAAPRLLTADVAGFVYSYQWYPYMRSSNPATACFATTSRAHPVQLWDATKPNKLRATYRCVNEKEELDSATSLCFAPNGTRILAGCERVVRVFDISRPG